ncbi:hypothetical protein EV359DRAFT_88182 [Lentinula novae-zelandiae]|nr:hypothetical protein EV359DRAFT_88182 [Lentinula novae-zelandiae]
MLISGDAEDRIQHPYWFARIIGVFHINIVHSGLLSKSHKPQEFNVLYENEDNEDFFQFYVNM